MSAATFPNQAMNFLMQQQDVVSLQRARGLIERRRHRCESAVQRFRDLRRRATESRPSVQDNGALRVHLNPLRAWCRLGGATPIADATPSPAAVLLFAIEDGFATKAFDLEEQTLINELADFQPCTLNVWAELSALATRDQLIALCQELHQAGLVCLA